MLVVIEETTPGEFQDDPAIVRERLHGAIHKAMAALAPGRVHRGGEVEVVPEVAALTERLYLARHQRMIADVARMIAQAEPPPAKEPTP